MAVLVAIICRPYGMSVCDMPLLYSVYWLRRFFFLFFFFLPCCTDGAEIKAWCSSLRKRTWFPDTTFIRIKKKIITAHASGCKLVYLGNLISCIIYSCQPRHIIKAVRICLVCVFCFFFSERRSKSGPKQIAFTCLTRRYERLSCFASGESCSYRESFSCL